MKEPKPVLLGDAFVRRALNSPAVRSEFPELQRYADQMKKASTVRGGCGACRRGNRERTAMREAHNIIRRLPATRLAEFKKAMGVRGPLKFFIKEGRKLVSKTI